MALLQNRNWSCDPRAGNSFQIHTHTTPGDDAEQRRMWWRQRTNGQNGHPLNNATNFISPARHLTMCMPSENGDEDEETNVFAEYCVIVCLCVRLQSERNNRIHRRSKTVDLVMERFYFCSFVAKFAFAFYNAQMHNTYANQTMCAPRYLCSIWPHIPMAIAMYTRLCITPCAPTQNTIHMILKRRSSGEICFSCRKSGHKMHQQKNRFVSFFFLCVLRLPYFRYDFGWSWS